MTDEQREAIEWAEWAIKIQNESRGPTMDVPISTMMVEALLDLARSAESAEARMVERCIEAVKRYVREDSPASTNATGLLDEIRSLAPEPAVCRWWQDDPDDYWWNGSCGHSVNFGEDVNGPIDAGWTYCPFKGCGRPIRVKEE